MKKYILLSSFFFIFGYEAYSQCAIIDSLERVRKPDEITNIQVDIQNQLSIEYASLNKKKSLDLASKALYEAQKLEYKKGEALALINKASVQYAVNPLSLDEVISYYTKALAIYNKIGDEKLTAAATRSYASFYESIAYSKKDYLDSATKYYEEAYRIFEKLSESQQAAEVAGNIAEVYFEKGDDEQARVYSEKSIDARPDTQFSSARIIKKSLDEQAASQKKFITYQYLGISLLLILILSLIIWVAQSKKANRLLQKQKADLAEKNNEINRQNAEIEKRNKDIQETMLTLENRNKEIDRQNKEILLQQTEIEMRNIELGEKNEELKQQQEEILTQRDNLEKQSLELSEQADELQKSYETITILSRIGQSITSTLDYKEIFDTFYGYVTHLMPADGFRVSEYLPEYNVLEYRFNTELQKKKPLIKVSMDEENNPAVWCIKNARSIMVNKKSDLNHYDLDEYSINPVFNSMIYFPMLKDGKPTGVIGVYCKQENAYNLRNMEMIKTLSAYTEIALQNAKTYEILNAAQQQLVEAEKMAALGNLVAGVAHEINTPVGICVTAASKLETKTKDFNELFQGGGMKKSDLVEYLNTVGQGNKILLSNLTRAADLVQGFKRVAVEQSNENKRVFNLKVYLEETIMALKAELKNRPYDITLDSEDIEINSFAGAFSQILTNLVMNSLIHGFKGKDSGHIRIDCKQRNKDVVLIYSDDGNGMTKEVLDKIYEPFFTTNREGGGTGLGMNIVYNLVVQKLGGKLNVESVPGNGVKFTFEVPMNI